jgi:3-hydroxyacyl-[acyl-carrier-protein] dehydratase
MFDIKQIMEIIPHRPPFLLVDRILECESGVRAVGIKSVTMNEPFFVGHFPGEPIMPGVLIVEALAQVGAVALLSADHNRGKLALFAGINEFRFRGKVTPGDQLRLELTVTRSKGAIGKGNAVASVDGQVVAEGELIFAIQDRSN